MTARGGGCTAKLTLGLGTKEDLSKEVILEVSLKGGRGASQIHSLGKRVHQAEGPPHSRAQGIKGWGLLQGQKETSRPSP